MNRSGGDVEGVWPEVEGELVFGEAFRFVAGFELGGPLFVIVAEDGECRVGDVPFEQGGVVPSKELPVRK